MRNHRSNTDLIYNLVKMYGEFNSKSVAIKWLKIKSNNFYLVEKQFQGKIMLTNY